MAINQFGDLSLALHSMFIHTTISNERHRQGIKNGKIFSGSFSIILWKSVLMDFPPVFLASNISSKTIFPIFSHPNYDCIKFSPQVHLFGFWILNLVCFLFHSRHSGAFLLNFTSWFLIPDVWKIGEISNGGNRKHKFSPSWYRVDIIYFKTLPMCFLLRTENFSFIATLRLIWIYFIFDKSINGSKQEQKKRKNFFLAVAFHFSPLMFFTLFSINNKRNSRRLMRMNECSSSC